MSHKKAPPVRHDASGMRGERARTEKGTLRRKREDTLAGTLESLYHINLGVRSDKKLGNILRDEGVDSLSQLIANKRSE